MITEEEIKKLHERVLTLKMIELFEEPSSYEDYADNDFVLSGVSNNSPEV